MIYVGTYIWSMIEALEVLCFFLFFVVVVSATSWSYMVKTVLFMK